MSTQSEDRPWTAPVGSKSGRRIRYELIGCALSGHCLPVPASAGVDDEALVRRHDGLDWHRCLRCDAWLPRDAEQTGVPRDDATHWSRDDTEPPIRGRLLRDKYVLRLIALDRAVHVVVLALLAAAILLFAAHRTQLKARVTRIATDLQGGVGGPVHSGHGLLHEVDKVFALGTSSLYTAATVALLYAALEAVEMVGLWFARRWAEYLTLLATVLLLPIEVHELTESLSPLKLLTLLINLAIAIYLLLAKRLFGLRGGGAAERHERELDTGWLPIDRATPPVDTAP